MSNKKKKVNIYQSNKNFKGIKLRKGTKYEVKERLEGIVKKS